ncbi:hypothetical protein AB0C07_21715 [Actinoplanes missouriensis]|uniref:hypothetical protein n=1 Tax=Actinoplanes missouriensis TaxID=1866 RepID=UPI0033E5FDD1
MRRLHMLICGLTVAAFFALAGSWLGWRAAGDLPTDDQMRSIVADLGVAGQIHRDQAVTTDSAYGGPTPVDGFIDTSEDIGYGYVRFQASEPLLDVGPLLADLRERGWRVGDDGTASRGAWRLSAVTDANSMEEFGEVRVERAAPVTGVLLTLGFWVVGAVAGARLGRRALGLGWSFVVVGGMVLLSFSTVMVTTAVVGTVLAVFGTSGFPVLWAGLPYTLMPLALYPVVGLALLVTWGVIEWRRQAASEAWPPKRL